MVEKLIATPTEKNFSFDIAYYILLHYILLHCLVEMLMAQILIHLTSCCTQLCVKWIAISKRKTIWVIVQL